MTQLPLDAFAESFRQAPTIALNRVIECLPVSRKAVERDLHKQFGPLSQREVELFATGLQFGYCATHEPS